MSARKKVAAGIAGGIVVAAALAASVGAPKCPPMPKGAREIVAKVNAGTPIKISELETYVDVANASICRNGGKAEGSSPKEAVIKAATKHAR